MKKMNKLIVMVMVLILCVNVLVACGAQESESQPERTAEYYNIETTQKEMGTPSQTDVRWQLLNVLFFQGEAVQIWCVRKEAADAQGESLLDVYLYREDESTELLVSGITEEYLGTWFLDESGDIYIISGRKITGMTADGTVLYTRTADSDIEDICQLADGTIVLLVENDAGETKLAELDAESGKVTEKVTTKWDENGLQYLSAYADGLVLLDKDGLWSVNAADGSRESLFDFAKASYQMNIGLLDFRMVDEKNVELLYNGKVECLEIGEVGQEKEVIVVRNWYDNTLVRRYVDAFNAQSEKYHVALEVPADFRNNEDFLTQTNMEVVNGGGADVLITGAIWDVESYIEKGVLEDLKPYMDASGVKEEDFFPVTFDTYRDGDKIYGILVEMGPYGFCMDESLTGGLAEPDIETVVNGLLNAPEETIFKETYTASWLLKYFLEGSESLWGMVDWEKHTCDFDSELFAKLLRACKLRGYEEEESCTELSSYVGDGNYFNFETRADLEEKGLVKVGYLFDDGCHMTTNSDTVWVMNSSSKNKEGVWEFFTFLLSEEFQMEWEVGFPTNRKAFERMIAREMEEGPIQVTDRGISYPGGTEYFRTYGKEAYLARYALTTEKVDEIREQMENTRALPYRVEPLLDIILEEAAHYFNDMKTIEEIIPIIENRVQLYLDE